MAFVKGQRVLVEGVVCPDPGSDRLWIEVECFDASGKVQRERLHVDVEDVQAAPPLPSRFRAGQVYKNSCDQNRYLITGVEDARVNFSDSNGEQGWFMLGSFIDDNLQLVLDVDE